MVVKIFEPVAVFEAVRYNTNKMDKGKGELLRVANFGPLMGYSERRPEDYRAYLEAVSALNKNIKKPVFHAMISAGGKTHGKEQLLEIAEKWLKAMGYGDQPYLAVFHKDTKNNHIHLVSTRITKQGKKINSGFEHVRAIRELNKIMGVQEEQQTNQDVTKALTYQFSTKAQFAMILENLGYTVSEKGTDLKIIKFGKVQDKVSLKSLEKKISSFQPDKNRTVQLKAIFSDYLRYYKAEDLAVILKKKLGLVLVFHASAGKPPYGYSVIDHAQQRVFKGSEILPLKELLESTPSKEPGKNDVAQKTESQTGNDIVVKPIDQSLAFSISQDVDDEAVHGRRRKKKRKLNR
jgi:hypothetical protein